MEHRVSKNRMGSRTGLAVGLILIAGLATFLWARNPSAERASNTVADWPLTFTHLQFGGACFDTVTCGIRYNNFEFGLAQPAPPRSRMSPQQYTSIMTAGYGPVARIAPPAQLNWISKDGSKLEAQANIAEIFKDRLVRHSTPREDIAEGASMGSTDVIVEIEDRTVSVYTRMMIPLKKPLDPANRFSTFRDDLIKVWSKTY